MQLNIDDKYRVRCSHYIENPLEKVVRVNIVNPVRLKEIFQKRIAEEVLRQLVGRTTFRRR